MSKCEECVSRCICPNRYVGSGCLGWNDEQAFYGLLMMLTHKDMESFIKRIQEQGRQGYKKHKGVDNGEPKPKPREPYTP